MDAPGDSACALVARGITIRTECCTAVVVDPRHFDISGAGFDNLARYQHWRNILNKSLVVGTVFGAVAVTAGGAFAGYHMLAAPSAQVVSSKALVRTIKTPRQECHDEQVTRTKPAKDTNRIAGTGIGAVVGGLLGHGVGGGNGKVLATVAGAAAGGYAGNKIEQRVQQGDTYTTTEQRCVTAYDSREVPNGFEVTYELNGKQHHVHMDHDPGRSIAVKDGRIVTNS
jgi:uncharacterized protein YcfJ